MKIRTITAIVMVVAIVLTSYGCRHSIKQTDEVTRAISLCGGGISQGIGGKVTAAYMENLRGGDLGLVAYQRATASVFSRLPPIDQLEGYKEYTRCIERSGIFPPNVELDCSKGCIVYPTENIRVGREYQAVGIAPFNLDESDILSVAIRIRGSYWPKETILLDNRSQWEVTLEENATSYDLHLFRVNEEGQRIIETWRNNALENNDFAGLNMDHPAFNSLDRIQISQFN